MDTLTAPSLTFFVTSSVDAVHDAWVDASMEAQLAYDAWCLAAPEHRAEAYVAFVAARDREDAAALAFAIAAGD